MERKFLPPPTRFPGSSAARQPMRTVQQAPSSPSGGGGAGGRHGSGVPTSSLQRKAASPQVIQRYVWGVIDTDDKDNQIVTGNINRFTSARSKRNNIPKSTDTNISNRRLDQVDMDAGPLHLHGHGREDGFALMSASTFAARTKEKFGTNALKSRTIVFHSCEVGQQNFLKDFLRELIGSDNVSSWSKALVFGPTRFLGVNHDGISLVSLATTTESAMRGVSDYFHDLMEKKGRGWRVAYVQGGAVAQKDVTVGSKEYAILKNALSLPKAT